MVGSARDPQLAATQAAQMLGADLRIEQREADSGEATAEREQGKLGSMVAPTEHRLAKEHAANGNAVNATDQLATIADFQRVCMAKFVQVAIRREHFRGDPGAVAAVARLSAGTK